MENTKLRDSNLKRNLSFSFTGLKTKRKNLQIKSNISSLVKKYANYLFHEAKIDKETGRVSKNQFYELVKNHPSIFNVYFLGFHTYVWLLDDNEGPLFKRMTSWI